MRNAPSSRVQRLSTWSPVGGAIWGGLEGGVLLKKVCHWGADLRTWSLCSASSFPLCFLSADEAMSLLSLSPSLLLSVSHLSALVQSYPAGTVSTLYVALLCYSITANLRRSLTCRSSTAPIRSFERWRVGRPVDWQGWDSIKPPCKASSHSQSSVLALVSFLWSQANPSAAKLSVISKRHCEVKDYVGSLLVLEFWMHGATWILEGWDLPESFCPCAAPRVY